MIVLLYRWYRWVWTDVLTTWYWRVLAIAIVAAYLINNF